MSITDELREFASHCAGGMGGDALRDIADRIDEQHAKAVEQAHADGLNEQIDYLERFVPSNYVLLPVDADGVPIHVGDELTDGKVARLLICDDAEENSVYVYETPHIIKQINCCEVVHRKPDSWERIIHDAFVESQEHFGSADAVAELVERCRKLAGDAE